MAHDRPSVFFYTFHKCASSLFSAHALPKARGLVHVDYGRLAHTRRLRGEPEVRDHGHLYGPIRISAGRALPRYEPFRQRVVDPAFVVGRRAVFMVRDPRDMLVSQYFSFGFSHALSSVPEVRARELERRGQIASQPVDEFVLERMTPLRRQFDLLAGMIDACPDAAVLRFEDMVGSWPAFERGLTRHLDYTPGVLHEIYHRSRPPARADDRAKRRSGRQGGFRAKLRPETIARLDEQFAAAIARFRFDAPVDAEPFVAPPMPWMLRVENLARRLLRRS